MEKNQRIITFKRRMQVFGYTYPGSLSMLKDLLAIIENQEARIQQLESERPSSETYMDRLVKKNKLHGPRR